jgi:hypothetical protein
MGTVLDHLEKNLGSEALRSTAGLNKSDQRFPIQISLFNDQPVENAFTLSSAGLSEKIFEQPDKTLIRHEVIFGAYDKFRTDAIYQCLFNVLQYLVNQEESICIGQTFDYETPLIPGSSLEAFLFYKPIYYEKELFMMKEVKPPVFFMWAIPLCRTELVFIERNGVPAFEKLLEEHDPDLLDLNRGPIVK